MFRVVDRKHFEYCSSLQIKSVTRVGKDHWICNTDSQTVLVKLANDVLLIGAAEREYDVTNELRIVGIVNKVGEVSEFSDIVYFLRWVINDDYCWS